MKAACRPSRCSAAALLALLALCAPCAQGQEALSITSSPNPVGSGARALGMGGAFIAVADDATAASWNPGGLTQLERPELSIVYDFSFFREDFASSSHPELNGDHEVDLNGVNYLSVVYPIPCTIAGRNLVLSLNYQRMYDFDRDLDLQYKNSGVLAGTGSIIQTISGVKYRQRGELAALSPAFGFEITNRISVGAVINLWHHQILPNNEWEVRQTENARAYLNGLRFPVSSRLRVERNYEDFEGVNFTIGALFKPTPRLSLGAVYHTGFTARVKYTEVVRLTQSSALPGFTRSVRDLKYEFPSAFGIGAAYRFPKDRLTLSFDVTRREWDDFVIRDKRNRVPAMRRRSAVTGLPKGQSPHDPTYTVRLGAEYVFINEKKPTQHVMPSLRAGVFYDPEPAGGRRQSWRRMGKLSGRVDDFFGVSLGGGLLIMNRVNLDAAYVYRWGDEVRADTFGLSNTHARVDQHFLYLSTVVYF